VTTRAPKRPPAFEVAPARVRVKRGPHPDNGRSWYWRADKPDGKGGRVDVWTGWGTKDEAAAAVRDALAEQHAGTGEIRTIGDLLSRWGASIRADRDDPSDRTRVAIEGAIVRLLAHGLEDVSVLLVGRDHLVAHRQVSTRAGIAGATIARDLKYLRQAWRWGRELNPPEIPLRDLPRIRVEVEPVYTRYTPTAAEVGGLLDKVSPAVRRALVLMASTGMRIGEALGIRWRDVPLDARRLPVDGKTGPRWVELHPVVAAEVQRWERGGPDDLVVGVSSNRIRVVLAERSAALGIPRCSPNSLRRHVVDALYVTGMVDAAASQLGHSAETALRVYRQVREERRREAVEAADLGVVLDLAQRLAQPPADRPAAKVSGTPKGRNNGPKTPE
jgi:integrase